MDEEKYDQAAEAEQEFQTRLQKRLEALRQKTRKERSQKLEGIAAAAAAAAPIAVVEEEDGDEGSGNDDDDVAFDWRAKGFS
ncbi:unnamed protein product [Polarella glacialis]|uniref:Uncharacterized protein n=1 Tax=Polarella glacialis TaxID=89957 RepID=A0A813KHQ2_POLGL|nr:unnamed protein product [Polarella glacialis]